MVFISETAGPDAVREWLTSQNYPQDKTDKIVAIVEGISFKNELGVEKHPHSIELDIVRDADRLDAIGAVGMLPMPIRILSNYSDPP